MFCGRPDCEAIFRWGKGESVHTRKTRTEILPLIFMGILKTNTSVFRLEEGRRKGFKHPKSRGKKLFLWSLWENKKNELRCITIGRGQKEGFKHPESKDINCSFELHGVNSIFLVYRNNSTRSIRVGPQANHVKDVMAILRLCYGMFAILFNWSVYCFNISTKFKMRSSKAKPELYIFSILPRTPAK